MLQTALNSNRLTTPPSDPNAASLAKMRHKPTGCSDLPGARGGTAHICAIMLRTSFKPQELITPPTIRTAASLPAWRHIPTGSSDNPGAGVCTKAMAHNADSRIGCMRCAPCAKQLRMHDSHDFPHMPCYGVLGCAYVELHTSTISEHRSAHRVCNM